MSSLYVHIPFCKQRCKYCTFVSTLRADNMDQYISCLVAEGALRRSQFSHISKLDTIFLGGGTPSYLGAQRMRKLLDGIKSCWQLSDNYELSVECNPESVDMELAETLVQCGVNRVSLGLQSSNNSTLATIGRLHNVQQFDNAVGYLSQCGITNINADIILGLPESRQSFFDSLRHAVDIGVSHLSVYALEVHHNSAMYKEIKRGLYDVPSDEDYLCDLYDDALKLLSKAGYNRYEVSNFAKEGCECRHNLNYWQGGEYLGLGCAAHWYIGGKRYRNATNLDKYIESVDNGKRIEHCYECVDNAGKMQEKIMLGLRLAQGVDVEQFEGQFGVAPQVAFPRIADMIAKGMLIQANGTLTVAPDKMYVLNLILAEIL